MKTRDKTFTALALACVAACATSSGPDQNGPPPGEDAGAKETSVLPWDSSPPDEASFKDTTSTSDASDSGSTGPIPVAKDVPWTTLASLDSNCKDSTTAMLPDCMSAYHLYGATISGENSGFGPVEKSTTGARVVAIYSDIHVVPYSTWSSTITSCNGTSPSGMTGSACASAVHRYCKSIGQATGFGPVETSGNNATLGCLTAAQAQVIASTYTVLKTYQSACDGTTERWGGECNAAINRFCTAKGAVSGFGPVENSSNNVTIVCVNPVGP